MSLNFHKCDLGAARKTHDVDLFFTESFLKIFSDNICIIEKIIYVYTVNIDIFIICNSHITVVPIHNCELIFDIHVFILIRKDIIVCAGAA